MAKQTKEISAQNGGSTISHVETFDDGLLPSPEELARYKNLDHKILDHILQTAKEEQKYRHAITKKRVSMLSWLDKREFIINYTGLIFAFSIMGAGEYFSYLLVVNEFPIWGSVFAGATLILGANLFINAGKNDKTKPLK